jgi:hypothetical protein
VIKRSKKTSGIFRLLVGCLLILTLVFAGAGSAFAYDSTESLAYGRGWLPNDAGALGKNFRADYDVFYAGSTYKFKKSGVSFNGDQIKLVSLQWYAGKKKISTKLSYKIPAKYLGKSVYVKVKYRVNNAKKIHTQTIKGERLRETAFSSPACLDGSQHMDHYKSDLKLTKGKIFYRLSNTGMGTKDDRIYAVNGQTYSVTVSPLATKDGHYLNATAVRDYNFAHTKKLSGTKIKYQWYYLAPRGYWVKISGADGRSYTATEEYDGYILGVTFSITKKNYASGYGFANMQKLEN